MNSQRALLGILTLAWAAAWIQRAALSPVGPLVQKDLGVDLAALGLLPALGLLSGAAGYLVAGHWASGRPRASLLAGAGLLGLTSLGAWASRSYLELAASQALAGFAEGLLYVPALALVSHAFAGPASGRALGVLDMGISVGITLALVGAPLLVPLAGWRGIFLAAGALGLATLPLLARATPRMAVERRGELRDVLLARAWPMYAAIVLLLVAYFSIVYLAPAFLVARGFALQEADFVSALAIALGIPWHLAGGYLADRWGAARTASLFSALGAAGIATLALPLGASATALVLIATYSLSIAGFIAIMALVPKLLGAHLAAPAFGVFWCIGYLGGAVGPWLFGAVADAAGFSTALLVLAGMSVAAAGVLAPLAYRKAD